MIVKNLADPHWVMIDCNEKVSDAFICKILLNKTLRLHDASKNSTTSCLPGWIGTRSSCLRVEYKYRYESADDMVSKCAKSSSTVLSKYTITGSDEEGIKNLFSLWAERQITTDQYIFLNANNTSCLVFSNDKAPTWKKYK